MARQPYFVNTTNKQMEVYGSFGGGMASQPHPEKLHDSQSIILENVDLIQGGVVESRGAYSQTNAPSPSLSGYTQGKFQYRVDENTVHELVALNGQLYKVTSNNTYAQFNITGLASFQTSRPIEAVQVRDKMYFATGSGLVVYDGAQPALVTAYAPTGLEALYIGTNGYAQNPENYLSDTTGAANVILGVTASSRYGVINTDVTYTAYIQKVLADTLEYKFEYKQVVSADYTLGKDWSTSKTWTANFGTKADYMIRVSMRKQGTEVILSQYVLPRYKVNNTPDEKPEPSINFDDLKLCNRILYHYDRLWLYGDTGNPDFMYISHLNKFNYFPRTNTIKVTDPLRGDLQAVQQYKNFLVCFTNGSIQMVTGRNPQEFELTPIHTTLGTEHPYSVQVMKNHIAFVGNDDGIYILKSFNYASDDKLNVERIDANIRDVVTGLLKTSTNVLSCIYNNQYYLYIKNVSANYIYRFYYEEGIWVRDRVFIDFKTLEIENNTVTGTAELGGIVYRLDKTKYKDGTNVTYYMRIVSKDFNFGMPHHRKKLKQYQILAKMTAATTISVKLYLDNNLLSTTSLVNDVLQNTDAQKLKIMASGRFRYVKTDIEIQVNETVQLVGFGFVFKQNTPK